MNNIDKSDIEWLFTTLMRLVGALKWRSQNGVKDDGTWLTVLRGMSRNQIELGVRRFTALCNSNSRGEVWAPSALDFRDYCFLSVAELNIPGVEEAYSDAVNRIWDRHPIVYLVNEKMSNSRGKPGAYVNWRLKSESVTRPWFERIYNKFVERARKGEKLVLPMHIIRDHRRILENQSNKTSVGVSVQASVQEHLKKMRAKINGEPRKTGTN